MGIAMVETPLPTAALTLWENWATATRVPCRVSKVTLVLGMATLTPFIVAGSGMSSPSPAELWFPSLGSSLSACSLEQLGTGESSVGLYHKKTTHMFTQHYKSHRVLPMWSSPSINDVFAIQNSMTALGPHDCVAPSPSLCDFSSQRVHRILKTSKPFDNK
ncbi:hypothetical protein EYF80_045967 [Liparis tanakae]|uniref:Uncharacterized protein n=1 Tax=Liparis tanakae TaxID=230148 RepID=A0A4Z2FRH2_9TELE|nr:hypothetical protein EYF80_045967 [Liparis tanakae]